MAVRLERGLDLVAERDLARLARLQMQLWHSPAFDLPAALSIDGCTLFLTSERDGSIDVFVARKPRG